MRPLESWSPLPEEPSGRVTSVDPPVQPGGIPIVNVALFVATLVTTTIAGAFNANVAPSRLGAEWTAGLPFSLTLMSILLVHEMGHYVVARIHGVRTTLPFFLPGPPFLTGTFGAFIRMKSPPRDRRALFDVGAAGPWAGLCLAVSAAIYGLSLSHIQPIPPSFSGLYFGDSLLFKLLSRLTIGPVPYGFDIILHPIAMAGWFGLFVTMLNLLPVGQLDGGHVIYAMFGQRHRAVARAVLVLIVGVGFLGWGGWFLWATLLMFTGLDHPPTLDRETSLDGPRQIAGWLTLVIFALTFIPVPIISIEGGTGPVPEELIPVVYEVQR